MFFFVEFDHLSVISTGQHKPVCMSVQNLVPQPGVDSCPLPPVRMLLARIKTRQDDQRAGELLPLSCSYHLRAKN